MVHNFAEVPRANTPRSSFNRSHGIKTTFDSGLLIPIYADEALPGDTFNLRMTAFARMATPIHPVMDNLFLESFWFAVPNRLLWNNWEKFNGQQDNPGDSTDFTVPQQTFQSGVAVGGINDYLGIPIGVNNISANSLHNRAYAKIWNDWFRAQDLQNSVSENMGDSGDEHNSILRRGKRHDYFTSALPFPQKGDPVTIPVATSAPIRAIAGTQVGDPVWVGSTTAGQGHTIRTTTPVTAATDFSALSGQNNGASSIEADLTQAAGVTINELRQAVQIQRLQERDARGGTRYTEIIRSHFGVISPDQRLQRPEYLGGGTTMVNINPVAQTSETTQSSQTPQGNLSAYGTVSVQGHGFTRSFTEHCVLLGLVCVRADLTYQQGLNRMFSRRTRFDYYWPSLAQIGEQAIHNREIYAQGTAADDEVFGYTERYNEYRFKPSMITGQFRSQANESLDPWHFSQNFSALPALNANFIEETPPVKRTIAVANQPEFLFDGYIQLICARPMPLYGVPGNMDRL